MATRCCSFEVQATSGAARAGFLRLPHGIVPTPAFMPVGTRGAVKGLIPAEVRAAGTSMLLSNTYHLWIRPGHESIARRGGLHAFMAWDGPILTDSGGYQVFSLREHAKVSEQGVRFRPPEDGVHRTLTPELAVEIQEALGVDVAMAFDECIEWPATRERVVASTGRTTRWLKRCLAARRRQDRTALFGIVQGGTFADLRADHAKELADLDLDGYAIGGLSVGEDRGALLEMSAVAADHLPRDRARYLMGVGHPHDIVDAVLAGVDLFDCVLPTRAGRHGHAYTSVGRRNMKNAKYVEDDGPLDPSCACPTCATFPLAYLRHLHRTDEHLGKRLLTQHNLWYYQGIVRRVREAVVADDRAGIAAIREEAARA